MNLTFPFSRIFGEDDGFDEWMDEMLDLRPETDDEKKELKRKMREVKTTYIKPVLDYEFPMVTLTENTTPEAVCTIFETLNKFISALPSCTTFGTWPPEQFIFRSPSGVISA